MSLTESLATFPIVYCIQDNSQLGFLREVSTLFGILTVASDLVILSKDLIQNQYCFFLTYHNLLKNQSLVIVLLLKTTQILNQKSTFFKLQFLSILKRIQADRKIKDCLFKRVALKKEQWEKSPFSISEGRRDLPKGGYSGDTRKGEGKGSWGKSEVSGAL